MEEKKITEVIQEIKTEVSEILAFIKNMDFKYTLLLDRFNKLVTQVTQKEVVIPNKIQPVHDSEITFPEYQSVQKKTVLEQTPSLKSKIKLALEQARQDQPELSKNSNSQYLETQIRQIPTQQRINYSDGKPVFMATVEIFDSNQNLVKQTKTNQVGKWLASLGTGEYIVKVTKGNSPLKPKVVLNYRISIPNQDSIVDLGTITSD